MTIHATRTTSSDDNPPFTPLRESTNPWNEFAGATRAIPISIVMPAFNESASLATTLHTVIDYLMSQGDTFDWEIIVVDDGSTDDTAAIAAEFSANDARVRMLRHATNQQLGGALKTGFRNSRGDYIITLDADLSYGPEHIKRLVDALRDNAAAIAIASPYAPDGRATSVPFMRHLLSRGANQLLSVAAHGQLTTLTSMVRGYDATFVRSLDLRMHDVGLNTEAVHKAQLLGARIVEIPAHLDWSSQRQLDSQRKSSMRIRDSVRAYLSAAFRFRPSAIFILAACVLATGAITLAIFADSNPTRLVATVTAATAVIMAGLGAIAIQLQNTFADLYHLCQQINGQVSGAFKNEPPVNASSRRRHHEGART